MNLNNKNNELSYETRYFRMASKQVRYEYSDIQDQTLALG
jgi:hypothetical protein